MSKSLPYTSKEVPFNTAYEHLRKEVEEARYQRRGDCLQLAVELIAPSLRGHRTDPVVAAAFACTAADHLEQWLMEPFEDEQEE